MGFVLFKVTLVQIPAPIRTKAQSVPFQRAAPFWRTEPHIIKLITATFDCSYIISVRLCFAGSHWSVFNFISRLLKFSQNYKRELLPLFTCLVFFTFNREMMPESVSAFKLS